ncbi:MAG TPA: asparagine synthase (glutamine-hydrolyzing) [Streptosporangiaceae bacterium]
MCGIAGIVSVDHPDAALVRRMCSVLTHRGPDGGGYFDSAHAVLGMRRLAIIDVAGGQQPVYNEDRTVVAVFNGEIYNYRELRTGLRRRGHRFTTGSDTECLVHLYEEYGDRLVDHLRGMFAFALWDTRQRRLLLARDRVGKKPLYWRRDGGSLLFGSELKALAVAPEPGRRLDLVALHHYLTYQYVPAPWSIYEGTEKLAPGHILSWQDGDVEVRRYWRLDCSPVRVTSVPEAAERLRGLLLEATRIRMFSERPLGAFLSGGVDSSAVVAAMARSTSQPVKTFSIGFDDAPYDERPFARMLAAHYGTDHQELVVTSSALDVLPSLAWHFDEPFADSSAIPTFCVAQMSSQQVTVVLTGDGGDESFGGYQRYLAMTVLGGLYLPALVQPGLRRARQGLRAAGGQWPPLRRLERALAALGEPSPPRRYSRLVSYFTAAQKHQLYTDELREQLRAVDSDLLLDHAFAASAARSRVSKIMDVDIHTYLPGDLLTKLDITTMACSLEARCPFLDHQLMEWAARLPARLKIRRGTTKFLLKQAMAPWLPPELISRGKQGFGVPLAAWLRGDFRELARDVLTDDTARSRGLFRPEAVARLLAEHDQGDDHASRLWALIQFELWHRAHVDPPAVQPASAGGRRPGVLPV